MGLSLLTKQTELAGLDIGSDSVKLIRLKKDGKSYVATAAVRVEIGSVSDPKEQAALQSQAVKRCISKAGLRSPNIVCGVAGPEVVVRGFKFPPLPVDAIPQAVRMEAQQVCPLDISSSVLDFQLVENPDLENKQKGERVIPRHGLMVVATEQAVSGRTELLQKIGVKPVMVDANALALLNCLNELELSETNETVAIIDIGAVFTNVVIYGRDGLPFVRDLNIAGVQMLRQLSKETGMTLEQLKQGMENIENNSESSRILLALNNAIRPLVMALNETLRFYSFQEKGSGVERIFLCGGLAMVGPFVEFLTDALPVDTCIMNPFEKISSAASAEGSDLIKHSGPAFAVATGLAMRTI